MKNLLLLSLIFICLSACVKEDTSVIVPIVGQKYNVKPDHYIFNVGAFQPLSPVLVTDLFIENGEPRAHIMAPVDWAQFALKSGGGVAQQTVLGNQAAMQNFPAEGIVIGDHNPIQWSIPQWDLKEIK